MDLYSSYELSLMISKFISSVYQNLYMISNNEYDPYKLGHVGSDNFMDLGRNEILHLYSQAIRFEIQDSVWMIYAFNIYQIFRG